ncbi:winged helix DNA-binding domain-containing protein [Streptomyces sp. NPDC046385]|uniref:winged helix DNA-binding domain-containing protein n=1 Tax=unclassified Streptomyces TaxID=2593676 RepID=UPI0033C51F85
MAPKTTPPVLSTRALNRATLDRQLLLAPSPLSAEQAVHHLVGLQAQNTKPPYYALAARLDGFRPEALSGLMESRTVARIVSLRSTVHTHTARDAVVLRRLVQAGAIDRELRMFRKGLDGVDLDRLTDLATAFVEERPRTPKDLRTHLLEVWPDADPLALTIAARCLLLMVQVTPRGLWRQSGQVALTTVRAWFGEGGVVDSVVDDAALDETVLRYLGAFGPASVRDIQTWCGLTRLRPAFERLRSRLLVFRDERGTELFDLPEAPRPDEDTPAPARFLPEFDNLLLSHADRTRVVPAEHHGRTWTANQAHRVFLLDGFLAGLWRLDEGKERTTLTIEPFGPVTRTQRAALTAEAERTLGVTGREGVPYDVVLTLP